MEKTIDNADEFLIEENKDSIILENRLNSTPNNTISNDIHIKQTKDEHKDFKLLNIKRKSTKNSMRSINDFKNSFSNNFQSKNLNNNKQAFFFHLKQSKGSNIIKYCSACLLPLYKKNIRKNYYLTCGHSYHMYCLKKLYKKNYKNINKPIINNGNFGLISIEEAHHIRNIELYNYYRNLYRNNFFIEDLREEADIYFDDNIDNSENSNNIEINSNNQSNHINQEHQNSENEGVYLNLREERENEISDTDGISDDDSEQDKETEIIENLNLDNTTNIIGQENNFTSINLNSKLLKKSLKSKNLFSCNIDINNNSIKENKRISGSEINLLKDLVHFQCISCKIIDYNVLFFSDSLFKNKRNSFIDKYKQSLRDFIPLREIVRYTDDYFLHICINFVFWLNFYRSVYLIGLFLHIFIVSFTAN